MANRNKSHMKDHRSDKRKLMKVYLYTSRHRHPRMTNSTSTDVFFGGACCNTMVAKHEFCYSTTSAEKHKYEEMLWPTILR